MRPETVTTCQEIIQAEKNLLLRGGGSKPALSTPPPGTAVLDMSGLSGIIEYEPGEYTFTAYAGTAVARIQQILSENGQYLPFDPLLVEAGATLGGTVAANSGGSGRTRYGGVRDFILGIKFIDGRGRFIRSGGKVVKNAAGFDLPKFMVGSLGRYGALVELSFKVFPQPAAFRTLILIYGQMETAVHTLFTLATQSFEMDALDVLPQADGQVHLLIRLGGLPEALPQRVERLLAFLGAETAVQSTELLEDDAALWQKANALAWADERPTLVKVPLPPKQLLSLDTAAAQIDGLRRYTAGGNVAWLAVAEGEALHGQLKGLGLVGLALRGGDGRIYFGQRQGESLARRVKQALDPEGTFLPDTDFEKEHAT